jgi:hypothetical protein
MQNTRDGNAALAPPNPNDPDMSNTTTAVIPTDGSTPPEGEKKGLFPWLKRTWQSGTAGKAGIVAGAAALTAGAAFAVSELLGVQGLGGFLKKKHKSGAKRRRRKSKKGSMLNGTVRAVPISSKHKRKH